jgi:hypothetical protein
MPKFSGIEVIAKKEKMQLSIYQQLAKLPKN